MANYKYRNRYCKSWYVCSGVMRYILKGTACYLNGGTDQCPLFCDVFWLVMFVLLTI